MTSISGCGGGASASLVQQLAQQMFQQADTNSNGSLSLSEFMTATTGASAASGTTSTAQTNTATQLFQQLDTNDDGSVSQAEFMAPYQMMAGQTQASLLSAQAQNGTTTDSSSPGNTAFDAMQALMSAMPASTSSASATTSTSTSPSSFVQNLMSEIDSNGDGTITKSELEAAVTKAGGTTQSADALWAKLDPSNSGSVNEQQLSQAMPHHHHHHGGGGAGGAMDPTQLLQSTDSDSDTDTNSTSLFSAAVQQYQTTSGLGSGISDTSALSMLA